MKKPGKSLLSFFCASGLALSLCSCGKLNPTAPTSASSPADAYPFLLNFGDLGVYAPSAGQLENPAGVAVYNNFLFVCDSGNRRIDKFDLNGNYLTSFSGGISNFDPFGIAISKAGVIYVTDDYNSDVVEFDQYGNLLTSSITSIDSLALSGPYGLALDGGASCGGDAGPCVYIADADNHRIIKCASNGSSPVTVGEGGTGYGFVIGLSVDGSGNLWATVPGDSPANLYVQELSPNLTLESSFSASVTSYLYDPAGILADSDGNLIIADHFFHNVQKFSPKGAYLGAIGSASGSGVGQFDYPQYIAQDQNKNLYISDSDNQVVLKFGP